MTHVTLCTRATNTYVMFHVFAVTLFLSTDVLTP